MLQKTTNLYFGVLGEVTFQYQFIFTYGRVQKINLRDLNNFYATLLLWNSFHYKILKIKTFMPKVTIIWNRVQSGEEKKETEDVLNITPLYYRKIRFVVAAVRVRAQKISTSGQSFIWEVLGKVDGSNSFSIRSMKIFEELNTSNHGQTSSGHAETSLNWFRTDW